MKRSEMLRIIQHQFQAAIERPEVTTEMRAELLLDMLENSGMLPPSYFCEERINGVIVGSIHTWESETDD